MATRYRVLCARPGLDHAPGLVGDYDDLERAREAAHAVKQSRPADMVSIQPGTDTPWEDRPPETRNPYGHHFAANAEPVEVAG